MNFSIKFSKHSRLELKNIYSYFFDYSEIFADNFLNDLNIFITENLSFMPSMFRIYKDDVRIVPYKNYIIFYEINENNNSVDVLHIVHWARDLSKLDF